MDGKGVVMRPGSLRAATAKAAASMNPKLATRLSTGEKRGRKRMAEVGAVYDVTRPGQECPPEHRHLRYLPDDQESVPGPPKRPEARLAERHRHHRRRLPPPRQRPDGPHGGALGTARCRGHPQATSPTQRRRLRHLLDLAPHPRTAPSTPMPLPARRPAQSPREITPEEPHPNQIVTTTDPNSRWGQNKPGAKSGCHT